ncbi:chemotaxis protein CheW [Maridesulfovibrio hydrothermalis]|uniref:CheW protein n=1 Tax=Maridesulfovibrio hydrothermalis AM13 = DSM 14728 TaxID=1121451 RepID=L0RHU3_9BACT|nr:chemotaxis protein CheW [Maridesulfovibrio hydrothermalis]CCO25161.1 CheW protein [Maridesulfovibrio hydrothermalis AM13 = DSM 14728]
MNDNDYVIFEVDSYKFAVPSFVVDKVERAVLLTPVPDAPDLVLGVVNDGGEIVPVLGLRKKMGLIERDAIPSDRLLFSMFNGRRIALLADSVSSVIEISPDKAKSADEIWPGVIFLKSFSGLNEDVILVQDMGAVLDLNQEQELYEALAALAAQGETEADG